jgi:hypothetical protein
MALPKKQVKSYLPLTYPKTLLARRHQIADMISNDGTYLPKSLLHADLDRGFLDFVKESLETIVEGTKIPVVDILITSQNWSQFVETWDFQNIDKNVEPPFITIIRIPEVKYGNNPSVMYNIPNRRTYYYMQVPTWDGQRNVMDIYKIPQPIPVDIKFQVAIVCNRMREINKFNQNINQTFASRQAYQVIKGHYIPIINDGMTDESVMDVDKRKYYIQKYDFTMMGFLLDEDDFEVSPAISRTFTMFEVDGKTKKKKQKRPIPNIPQSTTFNYELGVNELSKEFEYTCNMSLIKSENVSSYDIYINDFYFGSDLFEIRINTNDLLKIDIVKNDTNLVSTLEFSEDLL